MDDTLDCVVKQGPRRVFSIEDVGFFEGTEKLLEIWFDLSKGHATGTGLREIPRFDVKITC